MLNKDIFPGELILSEMPEVIRWLESLELSVLSSRFSRYTKHIEAFFNEPNPLTDTARDKFDKLTAAYHECLNIVIIKSIFENEPSVGFKNKLSKVVTGSDFLTDSPKQEARNYFFELLVSAKLSECGYEIDFNSLTDVVAQKNKLTVFIECKRIFSEKSFEKNFKEAGKQLKARSVKNTSTNFGLIFIDVSNCISNDLPRKEVQNKMSAKNHLEYAMQKFVDRQSNLIESLNERFSEESLAVCLFGQGSIWTTDAVLYQATKTDVRARSSMDDAEFNMLNLLLKGYG